MANTYDFYKPNMESEYPVVDGPSSVTTYLTALDESFKAYQRKVQEGASREGADPKSIKSVKLSDFDYSVFHSPYGKLVQKAYGRIVSLFLPYNRKATQRSFRRHTTTSSPILPPPLTETSPLSSD